MNEHDKNREVQREYAVRSALMDTLNKRLQPIFTFSFCIAVTYVAFWIKLESIGLNSLYDKIVFVVSGVLTLGIITITLPLIFVLKRFEKLARG